MNIVTDNDQLIDCKYMLGGAQALCMKGEKWKKILYNIYNICLQCIIVGSNRNRCKKSNETLCEQGTNVYVQ